MADPTPRTTTSNGDISLTSNNHENTSISQSSNFSSTSSSSYQDSSTNDLSILSAAALITADVLGTGILALPHDVKTLGKGLGIFFIVLNLPINLYAGTILCRAADYVEERIDDDEDEVWGVVANHDDDDDDDHHNDLVFEDEHKNNNNEEEETNFSYNESEEGKSESHQRKKTKRKQRQLSAYESVTTSATDNDNMDSVGFHSTTNHDNDELQMNPSHPSDHHPHHNSATYDFIGITSALFPSLQTPMRLVLTIYYLNLFLVLGNYILVMSHSVQAVFFDTSLEGLCLPLAGLIASILMLGVSQLRTMANLGRSVSVISLLSLAVVVVMCLVSIHSDHGTSDEASNNNNESPHNEDIHHDDENGNPNNGPDRFLYNPPQTSSNMLRMMEEETSGFQSVLRQLSALSSICFAIGSQKLLLNIRHEMKVRSEAAPQGLGLSLFIFGAGYISICLSAGDDPPSFLFDAISPQTSPTQHRLGGLFLWIHVSISYAINSQALCSSLDRLFFHHATICNLQSHHSTRWFLLTLLTSVSSYVVANAIPFFADLVSLIGALTSVPLTLLLPAIFYRRVCHITPVWKFANVESAASYLLLVVSCVFLVLGVFGSIGSISMDWEEKKSAPFSCQ